MVTVRWSACKNVEEYLYCHEIEKCVESLSSDCISREVETTLRCVTMHPGFNTICLNHWALRSAVAKYKTIDGRKYRQTGSQQTKVIFFFCRTKFHFVKFCIITHITSMTSGVSLAIVFMRL